MILPSIGILKAQRRRGEKKKTYFLFTKKIFENQYFFQNLFFENNFGFISHVQCLFILIYKRGQSFQFLSLTFPSPFYTFLHFLSQKILSLSHTFPENPSSKAENCPLKKVVFLTTRTYRFISHLSNLHYSIQETGSKIFPRKSDTSLSLSHTLFLNALSYP